MIEGPPRTVRFVGAVLAQDRQNHCQAQVELERPEWEKCTGVADGPCSGPDWLRAAAEAAAKALRKLLGLDARAVQIQGVEVVDVFGEAAVAVKVGVRHGDFDRSLIGFCLSGQDMTRAAALAVLNATNRVFGTG